MLTAKSEIDDRITGLDAGADDYLMKPFFCWRIISSYTLFNSQKYAIFTTDSICWLCSFKYRRTKFWSCKNLHKFKSHKETKLMKLFMTNMDKSLSTNHIFSAIWADEIDADENIVWIYISYLREKLEAINADIQILGPKRTRLFTYPKNK